MSHLNFGHSSAPDNRELQKTCIATIASYLSILLQIWHTHKRLRDKLLRYAVVVH